MSLHTDTSSPLAALALHDATLVAVTLGWEAAICLCEIRGEVSPGSSGARLTWTGVVAFDFARREPWGPSVSSLEARRATDGWDEIILQSGDALRVRASELRVELVAPAV
jgi:hypothetical protein